MWQSLRSRKGTDLFGSRRTRLGRAVRKLVREMQSDKVAIAAKLYSAAVNFRDYSRFNQMLICVQDPTATFLRGKRQWLASGHRVRAGAQAIHIIAPVLIEGSQTVQEFAQVNVYDVTDTDGPVLHLPALPRIDDPDDRAPKLYISYQRL